MTSYRFEASYASVRDVDFLWRLVRLMKTVGKTFRVTYNGRSANGSLGSEYSMEELLKKAEDQQIQLGLVEN